MARRLTLSATLLTLATLLAAPAFADEVSEKAAADLLDKRMQTTRPDDYKLLRDVQSRNIVVVRGSMDHVENVLAAAHIRHVVIDPEQVAAYDLNADQILMVNCPGNIPAQGIRRIQKFVRAGGLLYTTDWALRNVVERAFPGTIAHNGRSTGDEVTAVHVHRSDDNLMSNMILRHGNQPHWWLEGGSYPIKLVNSRRVDVLASSNEMKRKYGSAPVVVRFRWEDGEVIHVVSHFYRQLESRGEKVAAAEAVKSIGGLTEEQKNAFSAAPAAGASIGDVESSYAFQQMTSNLVVEKQKRNTDLDRAYGFTPKKDVSVEGRKVGKGERLRVLSREGDKVRVRDDRGNEAELPADTVIER